MQLWGLDAPVAAFFWGLAYATYMDIPMITSGPLLLLTVAVWLLTISARLFRAVKLRRGWYVQFYRSNLAPLLLLTLSVAAATLWMLFFRVGQILLLYAIKPIFLVFLGFLPYINRVEGVRGFLHATAFALACAVPASFFSVLTVPGQLWFSAPTWYLAILVFLYYLLRSSWQMDETSARKRGLLVSVGVAFLFAFCLLTASSAPEFERSLCYTIAIAAACLELLVRLRTRLTEDALFAIGWLTIALPPVLGMLIFA